MTNPQESMRGGEQLTEVLVEEIYQRASTIDLINQELYKLPREERPSEEGVDPIFSPGSQRFALLRAVKEAVLTGDADIKLPEGLDERRISIALSVMIAAGVDERTIKEKVHRSNPDLDLVIDEQFRLLGEYGRDINWRAPVYVRPLKSIDWESNQPAFGPLDDQTFSALVARCATPEYNDGLAGFVIADNYPEHMVRWCQEQIIDSGTAAGYKTFAQMTETKMQKNRPELRYFYPKAAAMLERVPHWAEVRVIGDMLQTAGEYEPTDFALSGEQLDLLLVDNFELEEAYDVGSNPLLRDNMFNIKPSETDEDMSSYLDEIWGQGVNILAYLDYLNQTGGCFHPASVKVIAKKFSEVYDRERSSHGDPYRYQVAMEVWDAWRAPRTKYSAQEVLNAWTIAGYALE